MVRRFLTALPAALILFFMVGCATPSNTPTIDTVGLQQKVLVAEVGWEGVQEVILFYKARPFCTTPRTVVVCKTEAGMSELRKINRAVVTGLEGAMKLASTPGITESRVVAALAIATTGAASVNAVVAAYKQGG